MSKKNGINCLNNMCDKLACSVLLDQMILGYLICLGVHAIRGRCMKLRMIPKEQTRWYIVKMVVEC